MSPARPLIAALLYTTTICIPLSVYCYLTAPDWSWMYWRDPEKTSAFVVVLAYLFYYVAVLLGYFFARAADHRAKKLGLVMLGVGAIGLLAFWAVFSPRAFYVGSRAEFFAGNAVVLLKTRPLFPVLAAGLTLAGAALIGSALLFSGRWPKRTSRQTG